MSDVRALEYCTLRVPYEQLNKRFRVAQKTVDREISHLQQTCAAIDKILSDPDSQVAVAELHPLVTQLLARLELLRTKWGNCIQEQVHTANTIKNRVQHLKVSVDVEASHTSLEQWKRMRVDRLLLDYLLRAGYYSTAQLLAKRHGLESMSNAHVYIQADHVASALRRHETAPCLEWCHENKSKLRRLQSGLELSVRQQEFIELVRAGQRSQAVQYARKWFSNVEPQLWQSSDLRRTMGLLAYARGDTPVYAQLMDESRWKRLAHDFWSEFYRVYQLPRWSTFSACLQSGLSALKTPQCTPNKADDNNCPICRADVHSLASSLPFAHAAHSRLVCYVSQQPLNENNVPMMLPNGHVYGMRSLESMALQNNGEVTCPRTNQKFSILDAQRVYVM